MLGRTLNEGDWIVFGTRVKNHALTRIAQVVSVGPDHFHVRSVKRFEDGVAEMGPLSGAVVVKNVLRLTERPF